MVTKRILSLLLGILLASAGFAQQIKMGICLDHSDPDTLRVILKPSADFDKMVSNVQFTLVWNSDLGVTLGEPVTGPTASTIPVKKAGEPQQQAGNTYQRFAGFGDKAISSHGHRWKAGELPVLVSIPVSVKGIVEEIPIAIGNDKVVNDRVFNGMFYAECNFKDATGEIGGCVDKEN